MKKTLLSTTVMLALAAMSTPAVAQTTTTATAPKKPAITETAPIELKVGGFLTWYVGYANQKKTTLQGTLIPTPLTTQLGNYNHFDVQGIGEIFFSGSATLKNGVKIGAMIQLKAGTDNTTTDQVIDEAYMTVDTDYGRVIAGNVVNVSSQMAVTAPDLTTLNLQDNYFFRLVAVPVGFAYNKATFAFLDDISPKLSYITPKVAGLTVGVSLMPGNKSGGQDANNQLNPNGGVKVFKEGIVGTALYEHDFGSFDLSASATYAAYRPNFKANAVLGIPPIEEKNINQYGAGLSIKAGNITVGGSYAYINMSTDAARVFALYNLDRMGKGEVYDFGIQYTAGAFDFGLMFLQSRAYSVTADNGKDDVFSLYDFSVKYKIAKGVEAFADVAYVNFDSASPMQPMGSPSNKGPAVAVGMNLAF